ncbi:MAG: transcription elongation factor GreA [Candidatus Cloacimonetes bacterium]|nr:transcription elongation factor GreA [Candidatus Cloacimonadota bacterium]MCF7814278.1 transcription elongation factor GreA [Candidatus Cloacimonadota bacterium]MCF7868939.1 transcription elongation factor GreA [Candidatus Cloacimonadota bacterium]MCF7884319.1 transcription elongation factor GreA [Candidatus Cloacimonadota bacterium]
MANYITKEGMQRLRKRMNVLIEERPKVIKQVVTAREMGDLSENAEYHAARERQRHLENEYNRIKSRIDKLQVIDISTIPKDAVRFGAKVTIKEISNQKEMKIYLVGIDEVYETDDEYQRKSVVSPFGKPMIGKKVGDHVVVKAPIGDREFEILEIK